MGWQWQQRWRLQERSRRRDDSDLSVAGRPLLPRSSGFPLPAPGVFTCNEQLVTRPRAELESPSTKSNPDGVSEIRCAVSLWYLSWADTSFQPTPAQPQTKILQVHSRFGPNYLPFSDMYETGLQRIATVSDFSKHNVTTSRYKVQFFAQSVLARSRQVPFPSRGDRAALLPDRFLLRSFRQTS
jgi:hypothetical protein